MTKNESVDHTFPLARLSIADLGKLLDRVRFDHFLALTDETGMLQHSKFTVPDRRLGYTTDDNARALIVSTREYDRKPRKRWLNLVSRFLSFLIGMQVPDGRFHNFMSYNREMGEDMDSGDHLGRSLWATGVVVDSALPAGVRASAKEAFDKALPWAFRSISPRVRAHAIKGLCRYISQHPEDLNAKKNLSSLVKQLNNQYLSNRSEEWPWFENVLAYENWRLPECLFEAHAAGEECLEIAQDSLEFLIQVEFRNRTFIPVGSEGWYPRNGARAEFDQLPVEAGSAVEALAAAARATNSSRYWDLTLHALKWYHGSNLRKVSVYEAKTGACYDGITRQGLNQNKGAESALSYILAVTNPSAREKTLTG